MAAYEALLLRLADPDRAPIYVDTDVCSTLMGTVQEPKCGNDLDASEQANPAQRVAGQLGDIRFLSRAGDRPPAGTAYQLIGFGPLDTEHDDGLPAEGWFTCSGKCGSGSVYILARSGSQYEIRGRDSTFGSWVS